MSNSLIAVWTAATFTHIIGSKLGLELEHLTLTEHLLVPRNDSQTEIIPRGLAQLLEVCEFVDDLRKEQWEWMNY